MCLLQETRAKHPSRPHIPSSPPMGGAGISYLVTLPPLLALYPSVKGGRGRANERAYKMYRYKPHLHLSTQKLFDLGTNLSSPPPPCCDGGASSLGVRPGISPSLRLLLSPPPPPRMCVCTYTHAHHISCRWVSGIFHAAAGSHSR